MNEHALKDRLKFIAKNENRSFQEVWKKLTLERLLVRISRSEYHKKFIFKGGLLLSRYIKLGRETKDLDFLVTQLDAKQPKIEKAFLKICEITVDDGFDFLYSDIRQLDQTHMNYPRLQNPFEFKIW